MKSPRLQARTVSRRGLGLVCFLMTVGVAATLAEPPPPQAGPAPQLLTLDAAVIWALQHNPELATLRQQHGIAAAAIVIAETYPFNPTFEGKVRAAEGPTSAGITNRVSNEHKVQLELELRHQGALRQQSAGAALSRTDWEIAFQETALAVRVARAFNAVLYRKEKLNLVEETVRLNQETADKVRTLTERGKLRGADLIVARTEVDDARAQLGPAHLAQLTAQFDLIRALGGLEPICEIQGTLEILPPPVDCARMNELAMQHRADLRARQLAVAEADARLRLEIANRYGNVTIGPAYEYDPTRINLIGFQVNMPLPVINTRQGEILQRQAERTRASLDLHQIEVLIHQDVAAAAARLADAVQWANTYRTQTLPNLRRALELINQLLLANDPGVDALRVIDIQRKLLKARDGYLDALFEISQARADLAAAAGDPALVVVPCLPGPEIVAKDENGPK